MRLKSMTRRRPCASACRRVSAALAAFLVSSAHAAPPSIGSGGGTGFALLTNWLQNLVNFMAGPFGIAVVVISIVVAFSVWAFAPKEGIAGPVMRIVVAAVTILNVGTWLATFTGA